MKKSTKGKDRAPLAIIILLSTIVCLCVFGLGMWCDRNVELLSELFSKLLFEQSYERVKGIYLLIREKRVDFLVSHISMTFITISVMSVLSENNLIIYWENLIKERLINPPFGCFSSLTIYAFYTMLFGFISFFADSTTGVFSFFVLDVIILTVLSSNMISVYYGRDKRKEKLEKEFCHAEKDTKRINLDKMQAYTIAAFENREYDKLMENCYFYAKYTDVNELRFMFGYILSKEKINAYECNVIEKIYEGLLENFGNRLESYDDWEVENIPDIYKSVIPVHNSYIRVLYDKYLYDERIDYGRTEFALLTASFIGKANCMLYKKITGKELKLAEIKFDNDNNSENMWADNVKNNRNVIDSLLSEEDSKVIKYFECGRKLIHKNGDKKFNSKFADALYYELAQLGYAIDNDCVKKDNESLMSLIGESMTKAAKEKFIGIISSLKRDPGSIKFMKGINLDDLDDIVIY